jgi:hypothetical protein
LVKRGKKVFVSLRTGRKGGSPVLCPEGASGQRASLDIKAAGQMPMHHHGTMVVVEVRVRVTGISVLRIVVLSRVITGEGAGTGTMVLV